MRKPRFILIILASAVLLIVIGLSFYAESVIPYDWYWTIREELRMQSNSKIDPWDAVDLALRPKDWDELIQPFIDIPKSSYIDSIDIYIIHPIKENHDFAAIWKKEIENYGIDSYLRENANYTIKITGARQIHFILLMLATSPVYDVPDNKNYNEKVIGGITIDINLGFPSGERKTYIMLYDKENVFYDKDEDLNNRVYRKMPEVLLENFTISYSEASKQFRRNLYKK